MKRIFAVLIILALVLNHSFAQEKTLVIREGKQVRRDIVALEGYLINNILEVAVEVRMYGERPKITNVALVGPGLGRLSYTVKEEIPLSLEEEEPYEIRKEGGIITTSKKKKTKKPTGTVTKELFKIKVPPKKILPDREYQLWVDVKSKTRDARPQKFKFKLKDFSEIFHQQQ